MCDGSRPDYRRDDVYLDEEQRSLVIEKYRGHSAVQHYVERVIFEAEGDL